MSFRKLLVPTFLGLCAMVGTSVGRAGEAGPGFDKQIVIQQGHTEKIHDIAYAPSGRFIVSSSMDGSVRLWSPDGRLLRALGAGFRAGALGVLENDDIVVSASGSGEVKILTPAGGVLYAWKVPGMITGLAVSAENQVIAVGGMLGQVHLCDIKGNCRTLKLSGQQMDLKGAIALSRDGSLLATGTSRGVVGVWKTADGQPVRSWKGHPEGVGAIAFSPDGDRLAVAGKYPFFGYEKKPLSLHLWRIDGTLLAELPAAGAERIAFSRDGKYLVSGDASFGAIRIWDSAGKPVRTIQIAPRGDRSPSHIAVSPDARFIAFGDRGFNPPNMGVVDVEGHLVARMRRLSARVTSVGFSPQGPVFAALSLDRKLRLWLPTGQLVGQFTAPELASRFAFSPDGRLLAAAGEEVVVWGGDGKPLARARAHKNGTDGLAFSPDGSLLLTCGGDGHANIYGLRDSSVRRVKVTEKGRVTALAIHPGGKMFAVGLAGGAFQIWNTDGEKVLDVKPERSTAGEYMGEIFSLTFDPAGKRIAVAGRVNGSDVRIYDLQGKLLKALVTGHGGVNWGEVLFSPKGRWLVATVNRTVHRWDGTTLEPQDVLRGPAGSLSGVSLSSDERLLAAAGDDGTVRLWNTATGASAALLADGKEWVIFTDDGYFDASRSGGGAVAVVRGMDIYGIEQFALRYNRPDIIFERLGVGAPEFIQHLKDRHAARLGKAEFLKPLPDGVGAPEVSIAGQQQEGRELRLGLRFSDPKHELVSYQIYANGVALFGGRGKALSGSRAEAEETMELLAGDNQIEISALNDAGQISLPTSVRVRNGVPAAGRLFYLGIGVSDYGDPQLNLHYAHKDALDLAGSFGRMKGSFSEVRVKTLTDAQATRAEILAARAFLAEARVDDTVVLFLGGHGGHARDSLGTWYFIPRGVSAADLPHTAVSFEELDELLSASPARRRLMLLDACESGELDDSQRKALLANAAAHNLSARVDGTQTGGVASPAKRAYLYDRDRYIYTDVLRRSGNVVFSSSGGGELSLESGALKNGVFTHALVGALASKKADFSGDGKLSFDELVNAVANSVTAATGGFQNPTIDRDNPQQSIAFPRGRD